MVLSEEKTRSGLSSKNTSSGWVVVSAKVFIPPLCPASMPCGLSSMTRHSCADSPRRLAALLKTSGLGLPIETSSDEIIPSKKVSSLCSWIANFIFARSVEEPTTDLIFFCWISVKNSLAPSPIEIPSFFAISR